MNYLKEALEDVNALIAITKQDIEDIKASNHEAIFSRVSQKEELSKSFTHKKESYAKSLEIRLKELFPNKGIEELSIEDKQKVLGEDSSKYTSALHDSLEELKNLNHHFGRMALAVSEFYDSLLKQIFPSQERGYKKSTFNASLLSADV